MIETITPYSDYRPSGLPWVPEVPEHWKLLPNRALIRKRKVLVGERHAEHQLLSLTKQGVIVRDVEGGKGKFSADMGTSQEVRAGDLVFCLFDVPETPRTVGLSRHDGMITGAYTVFECSDDRLASFLDLFYRAMDDRKLLSPLYSGLRNTIPPVRFLGTKTPIPPTDEQTAIVRFLDHADRRIRRYIRAKRQLISLLNEQKQAIIHRAVTRGLDPDVRLKASGVEWLGDVPEHWEVAKLSHWFRTASGSTPSRGVDGYYGGDIPWVKTGELLDSEIHGADEGITQGGFDASSLTMLPVNSLLIAMFGQGKTRGRTGLLKVEATVNQACLAILPNPSRVLPEYLQLWFISQYSFLRYISEARNATQPNLNAEIIRSQKVVAPPLVEQEQIILSVQSATETVIAATARAQQEIELLSEYRTRLIADVVTGKLDVREAAARLPDEVDEGDAAADELVESEDVIDDTELDAEPEEVEA